MSDFEEKKKEALSKIDIENIHPYSDEELKKMDSEKKINDADSEFRNTVPEKYRNVNILDLDVIKETDIFSRYVAALKSGKTRFLILCGNPGTGKTTVAFGMMRELMRAGISCGYFKMSKLMSDLDDARHFTSKVTVGQIDYEFISPRFRIVDEVGRWINPEYESFKTFDYINCLYERNKSGVFITNSSQEDFIKFIGSAAYDRLRGLTLFYEFNGESFRGTKNELYKN